MTLLAGDLGGTKTLLGLYDDDLRLIADHRYDSSGYHSLADMVATFLTEPAVAAAPRPTRAAFGVAGPVEDLPDGEQRARITNLSWAVEGVGLRALGLPQVRLVNDFYTVAAAAAGYRLGQLPAADLMVLNPGRPRRGGALAVLGAGTGLGEALVSLATGTPVIVPSEGGHSDFAPADEVEDGLLRFLRQRHGHVSWERVVCGAGLLAIYEYLQTQAPALSVPPDLAQALRADRDHAPALVSQHGLAGDDALCVQALERFAALYGAEAGNLALKGLATGGVYLAGGIAPKILPRLQSGAFLPRFLAKGRFAALLADVPVLVINNPAVGLLGAAVVARG